MKCTHNLLSFVFMTLLTSAQGAVIWSIGVDDNTQDGEGDAALNAWPPCTGARVRDGGSAAGSHGPREARVASKA